MVGVRHGGLLHRGELKRLLLLFEKIELQDLPWFVQKHKSIEDVEEERFRLVEPGTAQDLVWLYKNGIIIDESASEVEFNENNPLHQWIHELKREYYEAVKDFDRLDWRIEAELTEVRDSLITRVRAQELRKSLETDAVPILNRRFSPHIGFLKPFWKISLGTEAEVASVVIRNFPVPDQQTSLEQIIDFRNDPDMRKRFLALRRWMRKIAKAELPPIEINEELQHLLHQYEDHMRLHKLKIDTSVLETVITIIPEAVEHVVKMQWKKLTEMLFMVRHRKIALMEAEMEAPGREVAYILSSKQEFDSETR